jgi:hypothetical protein
MNHSEQIRSARKGRLDPMRPLPDFESRGTIPFWLIIVLVIGALATIAAIVSLVAPLGMPAPSHLIVFIILGAFLWWRFFRKAR